MEGRVPEAAAEIPVGEFLCSALSRKRRRFSTRTNSTTPQFVVAEQSAGEVSEAVAAEGSRPIPCPAPEPSSKRRTEHPTHLECREELASSPLYVPLVDPSVDDDRMTSASHLFRPGSVLSQLSADDVDSLLGSPVCSKDATAGVSPTTPRTPLATPECLVMGECFLCLILVVTFTSCGCGIVIIWLILCLRNYRCFMSFRWS